MSYSVGSKVKGKVVFAGSKKVRCQKTGREGGATIRVISFGWPLGYIAQWSAITEYDGDPVSDDVCQIVAHSDMEAQRWGLIKMDELVPMIKNEQYMTMADYLAWGMFGAGYGTQLWSLGVHDDDEVAIERNRFLHWLDQHNWQQLDTYTCDDGSANWRSLFQAYRCVSENEVLKIGKDHPDYDRRFPMEVPA